MDSSKTLHRFSWLFDTKGSVTDQSVNGWVRANTGLVLLEGHRTIMRRDYRALKKVRVLSAGFSGMEPMSGGFVGPGMLTAAVIGDKYCAPPFTSILAAIRELNSVYGIFAIVMNHPALRVNFSLAVDIAGRENIPIKLLFVSDDCSGHVDKNGRKGLAGAVFMFKIAGAMSEQNQTLEGIYKTCSDVLCGGLSTVVLNITADKNSFVKSYDNVMLSLEDYYVGNESSSLENTRKILQVETDTTGFGDEGGCCSHHKFLNIEELAKILVGYAIDGSFTSHSVVIEPDNSIVILFNNYGTIFYSELNALAHEVSREIENRGIKISRLYIGSVLANASCSFSISVMKVTKEVVALLDYPTEVSRWPSNILYKGAVVETIPRSVKPTQHYTLTYDVKLIGPILSAKQMDQVFRVIEFVVMALISCEEQINKMGANSYMNLYGTYMKAGSEAISRALYESKLSINCPYAFLTQLSYIASNYLPDMMGSCYAVFFEGAAQSFLQRFRQSEVTQAVWIEALEQGIKAIEFFTQLKRGDKSLLDALYPVLETLKKPPESLSEVAEAAELGSLNTVDGSSKRHMLPDPGSHTVAIWVRAAVEALKSFSKRYSEEFDEVSEDISLSLQSDHQETS